MHWHFALGTVRVLPTEKITWLPTDDDDDDDDNDDDDNDNDDYDDDHNTLHRCLLCWK